MSHYLYSALAAPKAISNAIRNLPRNFLWRGAKNKQKWALVAWEKICRPKIEVGLGLKDTDLLRKALGAKTLWRWLANPNSPWGILWKAKYAPTHSHEQLIRLNGSIKGSVIWNQVWENRTIIQKHSFWEIGKGDKALF